MDESTYRSRLGFGHAEQSVLSLFYMKYFVETDDPMEG